MPTFFQIGILACAFYLHVQAVVLECVLLAAQNSFVVNEIKRFLDVTGYHCTHCELHLHDVWPMRRSRAWWLLTCAWSNSSWILAADAVIH